MVERADRFTQSLLAAWLGLPVAGRSVLLAVSGGADSMALMVGSARVAARLGTRFAVATLDHGLRPTSRAEALEVVRLAEQLGLSAHLRALALAPGPGLEERARAARYQALEELRGELAFDFVATAHTGSDQAETLLMRLSRGTALAGAASILERRGPVLRPMLWADRAQVRAWLKKQKFQWVDDPMNLDPAFLRVRMRRSVLPALERAAGPHVAERLARFARYAQEDDEALQQAAQFAVGRAVLPSGRLDAIAVTHCTRPIARRVVAGWLSKQGLGVDAELVELVLSALATRTTTATLPQDRVLVVRAGQAWCEQAPPRSSKNFT